MNLNTVARWKRGETIIGHPGMLGLVLEALEKRADEHQKGDIVKRGTQIRVDGLGKVVGKHGAPD